MKSAAQRKFDVSTPTRFLSIRDFDGAQREASLQHAGELTQAVDQRHVDGRRIDVDEPEREVGDDPAERRRCWRNRGRIGDRPNGDVGEVDDDAARRSVAGGVQARLETNTDAVGAKALNLARRGLVSRVAGQRVEPEGQDVGCRDWQHTFDRSAHEASQGMAEYGLGDAVGGEHVARSVNYQHAVRQLLNGEADDRADVATPPILAIGAGRCD
jgi:hypothetical protein